MRLLLVDDSIEFLEAAERFLNQEEGIEIVGKARSGEEALVSARELKPDLILMDIAMPGINGLEATRRIKAEADPPMVILLTLYDSPEYRAVSKEVKADGFVTKSEFTEDLLPLIRRLFPSTVPGAPASTEELVMKHILITDDSPTMRRMVGAAVRLLPNISVSEAGNGLEAIEKLALRPVDLMILDLNMPDMHGLEVLHFLRGHRKYRDLPVIVLTTRGDEDSRQAALSAGAAFYMTKPFDPRALADKVRELLEVQR